MFTRLVTSALFAGFVTGLIAALLQLVFVQPHLLHAELYESGQLAHAGAAGSPAHVPSEPFDIQRNGLSILFTALIYCGYALILVAIMSLSEDRGNRITPRQGLVWGVAGFIAVHFAPAVGLPPELPGSAAADVGLRQTWWFSTVAATALAGWLLAFGTSWRAWGAAIVLLAAPHVIGAPHPDTFTGTTPPELVGLFAGAALGVGLAAWVVLGILSAYFWKNSADA
ncbi:hypothetical protein GCM10007939_20260 [Amylibacter marinus]|uniref:Cobalt transporter subunit CbtA n=1 Tax=Amylibacter marinus TaxID=1475483 RepID=A0ABQ5VXC7_9RHOB|nr:CbtA family protein [Amylibacter marinus]GLQ35743.1 hypothetical protein GCM10007939_20260 [Amylibacter marinus]